MSKIIIADTNENFQYVFTKYLEKFNYEVTQCRTYNEFKSNLQVYKKFLVVFNETIIKGNKKSLMYDINKSNNNIAYLFLINDEMNMREDFTENINRIHFCKKPFHIEELKSKIDDILQSNSLSDERVNIKLNIPLLEKTDKTKNIFDGIKKVVNNNLNVLISGESGTGKKQIINTIKSLMNKNNIILELDYLDYKHENFSKLLLNEIDLNRFLLNKGMDEKKYPEIVYFKDIDLLDNNLQLLLCNFLKSKLGKKYFLKDIKIIASTTKNIKQSLRNNNFSNELFYLLDMYNIFSIPLRDRLEDIKILIDEIILEFNESNNALRSIDDEAYRYLSNYIWPGNLTQLKNFINKCLNLSSSKKVPKKLIKEELDNEFQYVEKNFIENWKLNFSDLVSKNIRGYLAYNKKINSGIYYRLLKEFEKPLIIEILNHTNNNQLLSSELLGINRNTLRKKMADYEIEIVRKATKN